jgi:hypothetical protein
VRETQASQSPEELVGVLAQGAGKVVHEAPRRLAEEGVEAIVLPSQFPEQPCRVAIALRVVVREESPTISWHAAEQQRWRVRWVGWRIPGASQWKPDLTAAAATLEEHGVERAQLCRLVDGDLDNLARGREGRRDVGGGRGLGTRWPLGLPLFFHRTVEKKKDDVAQYFISFVARFHIKRSRWKSDLIAAAATLEERGVEHV